MPVSAWFFTSVRTIDAVLEDHAFGGDAPCPALIKVDVEGMEDAALSGAKKTIFRCRRPPALYVENNDSPDPTLAYAHCATRAYVAFHHVFTYAALFDEPTSFDTMVFYDKLDNHTSKNILCVPPWMKDRLEHLPDAVFLDVVHGFEQAALDVFGPDLVARLTRPPDAAVLYPHRASGDASFFSPAA